jgi:hypothetical protein
MPAWRIAWLAALSPGRDISTADTVCHIAVAGRDLNLQDGHGGIVTIGNQAHVENSTIGILLARSGITLKDSQVLVTDRQVIAFGLIAGAVFALLNMARRCLRK